MRDPVDIDHERDEEYYRRALDSLGPETLVYTNTPKEIAADKKFAACMFATLQPSVISALQKRESK